MHAGKVMQQALAGVADSDDEHDAENQHADSAGGTVKFLVKQGLGCGGHSLILTVAMRLKVLASAKGRHYTEGLLR